MRKTRAAAMNLPAANGCEAVRARVTVRGAVQGVGFRPFVYGLAHELGLGGAVGNAADGVRIEVEGNATAVMAFLARVEADAPPHARIEGIDTAWKACEGARGFRIVHSDMDAAMATQVLPDIATCPECLAEMRAPGNRRYRYPFLNCTHCGPRYSIIRRAPYDRCHTTMAKFEMCDACAAEYADPADRRFHAQPTACADCGPALAWWDATGTAVAQGERALEAAAESLRNGRIVALKGLGGFQLLCDAARDDSVAALRARKRRPSKPFAVMFPDRDAVNAACVVNAVESRLLQSPQAPIVLLQAREDHKGLSELVAPDASLTGAMLPYTPLHHLLMDAVGMPLVATSGNVSDEPICTDECEALERLHGIADGYLVHDRPIARAVDDSVVRVIDGEAVVLRNARGYAPLSVQAPAAARRVLAVGGHLKNAVAIAHEGHIVLSQHIGDLETTAALAAFEETARDLNELYAVNPDCIVSDLHPDYRSTRHAEGAGLPHTRVQHHYAHVLSCMAEHGLEGPVLGIAWDGTGYGPDGTIWGGEFLEATVKGFTRRAHLRPFRLPGGERAVREPRRSALGLLFEAHDGNRASLPTLPTLPTIDGIPAGDMVVLWQMLASGLNAPVTTSAGRLFDGVASIIGLCQYASFEGEAAMALESAAGPEATPYPLPMTETNGVISLDWRPLIRAMADDVLAGATPGLLSARFHAALGEGAAQVAGRMGLERVVLTGGCFQNARLYTETRTRLEALGLTVYGHRRVPPNDGGIAVGQAYFALHQTE